MPQTPPDLVAAFEKRLEQLEREIHELQTRSAWVIRDEEGTAQVVIGNLLPATNIPEFGIAIWDEDEKKWELVVHEEDDEEEE